MIEYEREVPGFLLSDKLLPVKERGKFIPTPIIKYYMGVANYLGSHNRDIKLQLFINTSETREADEVLARAGVVTAVRPGASGQAPLILLNPGAQYGAAK